MPLTCTTAIWGQCLVFTHPESPQRALLRGDCSSWLLEGRCSVSISSSHRVHLLFWCSLSLQWMGCRHLRVQFSSVTQLCPTPCDYMDAAYQASISITNFRSLLKLMSIESVIPSNHLILCHPLLLPPSIFPSIRDFSNESALRIRWPKYWSFSFSISLSKEFRVNSFRIDWFDRLAVQGTLNSLLQHHSSKASVLRHSAFFMVQLSHPYTTTEKTISLSIHTFLGKVMSLLFNMLSRFIVAFLPRRSVF